MKIGLAILILMACGVTMAGEQPQRACRSVHLWYPGPEAVAFCNEVTVQKSAAGTYFMACGFDGGYFGIQELGSGKKVVLFSVWEPNRGNDPKAVAEDRRVKLIAKGEGIRTGRFGGEGTGGQSFFDYDWKVHQPYRLLVTAKADGTRTRYSGYFYVPEKSAWQHLATFSTLNEGKLLRGFYSFIEDFRRDGDSATHQRRAQFSEAWVKAKNGKWSALTRARFTADNNSATNIDAAAEGSAFVLSTGGDTRNDHAPLGDSIDHPPAGLPPLPMEGSDATE
jgi:hypothetical protein